jgi:hypothetical protein
MVKSPNKLSVIAEVDVEALVILLPVFIVIEVAVPIFPTFITLAPVEVLALPIEPPFITTLPSAVKVPLPVALLAKSNLPAVIVVVPFTVMVGEEPKAKPPVEAPVLFTVKFPNTVAVVKFIATAVEPVAAMLFKVRLPIVVGLYVIAPPALIIMLEVAATVAVGILPPLVG